MISESQTPLHILMLKFGPVDLGHCSRATVSRLGQFIELGFSLVFLTIY